MSGGGEGDHFILFAAWSKVLPDFLERATESLSRGQCAKAQHRIISLFDGPVISFNPPVQICVAAMLHFRAECFPDGSWIRIMAVSGDLLRRRAGHRLSAAKASAVLHPCRVWR